MLLFNRVVCGGVSELGFSVDKENSIGLYSSECDCEACSQYFDKPFLYDFIDLSELNVMLSNVLTNNNAMYHLNAYFRGIYKNINTTESDRFNFLDEFDYSYIDLHSFKTESDQINKVSYKIYESINRSFFDNITLYLFDYILTDILTIDSYNERGLNDYDLTISIPFKFKFNERLFSMRIEVVNGIITNLKIK